jgi:hypothetical protein
MFASSVYASPKNEMSMVQEAPYKTEWKNEIKPIKWNPTIFSDRIKKQERNRKIASEMDQEFFENKMSKEFKVFRDEFLKIKTADDLDNKLIELEKNFDKYPNDLKFAASQLIPLRALRGIVWRLIPTVENTKIAHSILLTQVKSLAVNLKIFLPTDQWNAAFDYITKPFVENGIFPFVHTGEVVSQFSKGSELAVQSFFRSTIIPMMKKSAERLESIDLGEDGVVWDNKLLYGPGSFPSAMDRYSLAGEVERHIALMYLDGAISESMYQSAYSMEGSLKMNQEIGKLYGFDSFLSSVDGVPAEKRVEIIKSGKFQNWGKLFQDGTDWLNSSWYFLNKSVEHADIAWSGLKDREVSEVFVADSSFAMPFQRPINMRMDNIKKMMNGETKIKSFITEETTNVNIKAFYLSPPKDLKDLYATQFEKGEEMLSLNLQTKNGAKSIKYRNYLKGRPTNFKIEVYQQYFPGVKNTSDLQRAARILSQGWGSFSVATPLASYMN